MPAKITVEEWMAELERLGESSADGGGYTPKELAAKLDIPLTRANHLIDAGLANGSIKLVHAKRRTRVGWLKMQPTYLLVKGKKK